MFSRRLTQPNLIGRLVAADGYRLPLMPRALVLSMRHQQHTQFVNARTGRAFGMELNKLRSGYKRAPSNETAMQCIAALHAIPLQTIQGLDAKLLAQYLSLLELIGVAPDDVALESAAGWLVQHAVPVDAAPSAAALLGINAIAQCLVSLAHVQYVDLPQLVDVLGRSIRQGLDEATAGTALQLLEAVLFTCTLQASLSQLARDLLTAAEFRQSQFSVSERIMVVRLVSETECALMDPQTRALALRLYDGCVADAPLCSVADNISIVASSLRLDVEQVPSASCARITEGEVDMHASPEHLVTLLRAFHCARGWSARCSISSSSSSPPVCEVFASVERVLKTMDPRAIPTFETFCTLFSAAAAAGDDARFLPAAFLDAMQDALAAERVSWSGRVLQVLLPALNAAPQLDAMAQSVRLQALRQLQEYSEARVRTEAAGTLPIQAMDLVPLLNAALVDAEFERIGAIFTNTASSWRLASVLSYVSTLSHLTSDHARRLVRDAGPKVVLHINACTPTQLCNFAACYGRCLVRQDAVCEAIAQRASVLGSELTVHHMAVVLGALASVEYRTNKVFLDLAPMVLATCDAANAHQVCNLIVAYAKLLVWNFNLFAALANRAFDIKDTFSSTQMIAILTSFCRMSFSHDDITAFFLQKLKAHVLGPPASLTLHDCVQLSVSLSLIPSWDPDMFDMLAERLVQEQATMDAALLGEALLSFARVGLKGHRIFSATALRALALAPTCPPLPMAYFAQAYALAGIRSDEMFALFSERLLAAKDEFPAVVIAAILNGFAMLDIKDDRLFIEMIPRIRHVGSYGGPRDVANAVTAYSKIGLWHYKLFVRLADRAIQIRGECRAQDMIQIISSYGRVAMRYERLFVEFAPRLSAFAHLLTPSELHDVVHAYAAVKVFEQALFSVLADRVVDLADAFEVPAMEAIAAHYRDGNLQNEGIERALVRRRGVVTSGIAGETPHAEQPTTRSG